jgi:hypothetical protein
MPLPLLAPLLGAVMTAAIVRAVISMGFGVIVFTGFWLMKDEMEVIIDAQLGAMPASLYQILALGGVVDAIGIWLGAWTVVGTLFIARKFAPLPG